jgi:hypothetical protein
MSASSRRINIGAATNNYNYYSIMRKLDRYFKDCKLAELRENKHTFFEPIPFYDHFLSILFTLDFFKTKKSFDMDSLEDIVGNRTNYTDFIHGYFSFKVIKKDNQGMPLRITSGNFSYYPFEIMFSSASSELSVTSPVVGFVEKKLPFNYTGPTALFNHFAALENDSDFINILKSETC